jgi:hypothetical protein
MIGMDRIALDAEELSEVPELTTAAVDAARWNPQVGCLIDRVYPGHPLVVSFGCLDWRQLPRFEFYGRTKKLEARFGLRFNRILVRDVANAWYHRGVPGLGAHVDAVAATLRSLVRSVRPSEVVAIGQSMGGYAAVMFGMLLGVRKIVALGTLSHLDPAAAALNGDRRFLPVMDGLQADPPRSGYYDLPQLGEVLGYAGEIHLVFGTHPGHDDGVSCNLDAIHAFRLARLPNVTLHPYPEADHGIAHWLVENRRMDDVVAAMLVPGAAPVGTEPSGSPR